MARSNRSRSDMRITESSCNAASQPESSRYGCASATTNTNEITHATNNLNLWGLLPPHIKDFMASTKGRRFSLSELINFWSAPSNVAYTSSDSAGGVCGIIWHLALVYLKLQLHMEARALIINGSFMHQCYNSSIEYIVSAYKSSGDTYLPYFKRGYSTVGLASEEIKAYISKHMPIEYTQKASSFFHLLNNDQLSDDLKSMNSYLPNKKNVIDQLSDDWKSNNCQRLSPPSTNDGRQIKLILVDEANEDDRHSFDISSLTPLKSIFNNYAANRGISLRSLRFSYAGSMLFLSSAGHKSPEQLGMKDQDVIKVNDTSKEKYSRDDGSSKSVKTQSSKSSNGKKTKDKRTKKTKGKKKKMQLQQREEPCKKSIQEYKEEHSKQLTKIHEEAEARFKQIRQRLNNLVIVRSQRKVKPKHPYSPRHKPALSTIVNNPSKEGLGGKAGKSQYAIQVGETKHLYKTTKPSAVAGASLPPLAALDLHGCTQEEALTKLNESLKVWMDSAMQGSYPFVQPAVIVCGCGNQVLSGTVQEWIRSNDNVSNARKT